MGGAQPLAASLAGAASLTIECQRSRIEARLRTRYLDEEARDLDDALVRIGQATRARQAVRSACWAMLAELLPELVRRARAGGPKPDLLTDQTSAHDLINGYLPTGWSVEAMARGAGRSAAAPGATARGGRELRSPGAWRCSTCRL